MWTYRQSTGELCHDDTVIGTGYSGRLDGRNNPAMQDVHDTGPIPQGTYSIGLAEHHPKLGPCAMPLLPHQETQTFGRAGFFIHGDNAAHDASHGCLIFGPQTRQQIADSPDRQLTVIE